MAQRLATPKKAARQPRNDRSTIARRKAMLAAYAECGNITAACKAAGVDRSQHYRWLEDRSYAQAFDEAGEAAIEHLEAEATRRAMAGSDVLLIFLLKAARPAKYRENVRHEIVSIDAVDAEIARLEGELARLDATPAS